MPFGAVVGGTLEKARHEVYADAGRVEAVVSGVEVLGVEEAVSGAETEAAVAVVVVVDESAAADEAAHKSRGWTSAAGAQMWSMQSLSLSDEWVWEWMSGTFPVMVCHLELESIRMIMEYHATPSTAYVPRQQSMCCIH